MKVKLKNRKTGVIKEVTTSVLDLMRKDGRSRHYAVITDDESQTKASPKEKEPKKEAKEIKMEDVSKQAYPFQKKEEIKPERQDDKNKSKKSRFKNEETN